MTHRCLLTIIRHQIHCSLLKILHRMWLPRRVFNIIVFLFSFLFQTINRAMASFSTVVAFPIEAGFLAVLLLIILLFLLLYPQKSYTLSPYLPHLLHLPLKNLLFLLLHFSPAFNDTTFSSDSDFYCVFFVQICLPEPRYLFLQVLIFHLWSIDITRYYYWFLFFR